MTPVSTSKNAATGPGDPPELEEPFDETEEFGGDFGEEFDEQDGEPVEYIDESGRRHRRRAAPEGTEEILENEAPRTTGLPDKLERWRQRTATGTVLTAFAFGLQNVFEPERKEPAIIMQTSGDPPKDLPVEAQLEQLGPRQSSVRVRPWLLGGGEQATAQADGTPDTTGTSAAPGTNGTPGTAVSDQATGDEAGQR